MKCSNEFVFLGTMLVLVILFGASCENESLPNGELEMEPALTNSASAQPKRIDDATICFEMIELRVSGRALKHEKFEYRVIFASDGSISFATNNCAPIVVEADTTKAVDFVEQYRYSPSRLVLLPLSFRDKFDFSRVEVLLKESTEIILVFDPCLTDVTMEEQRLFDDLSELFEYAFQETVLAHAVEKPSTSQFLKDRLHPERQRAKSIQRLFR